MADHADDGEDDGDIFIYRGGRAPHRTTHARIDKSVHEIELYAFQDCWHLMTVDTHDGIRKIGGFAFYRCFPLRRINLKSAVEIEAGAFYMCENLETVEFGDRLETIGSNAFDGCTSLKSSLKLPSVIKIEGGAFCKCKCLTDIEFSEQLQTVGALAFKYCFRLQRIAIPLKRDLLSICDSWQRYSQFHGCDQLDTVDLVGGIHQTVASLHMDSWRAEMITEINRINQVLPNTPAAREKGDAIQQWMEMVLDKMDHYKAEHCRYVREGVSLLELALWKAKLDEKEESSEEGKTKKVKVYTECYRRDKRVTCGADIAIKNVIPFLQLE